MKQATIRDVAREAKVSIASVSRAINGHSNVNPATRERVLEAARTLGYVPNAAARSLSMALSHTIGVVVPALHGEFFSEMIRGMDGAASATGYHLLLSTMHADLAEARHAIAAMNGRVDGLIVMATQAAPAELDALLPSSIPAVLLGCSDGGGRPVFTVDNRKGAAAIAAHFAALERRSILHIMGPKSNIDARERREGFETEMRRLVPDATINIAPGDYEEIAGRKAVNAVLDSGQPFDAIFAANDMMALGAIQELRRRGVDVPGDVVVAGFDDIPLASFLGLTTMRVHMDQLGARAVECLTRMLEADGAATGSLRLVPDLIIRSSTGAVP